MAVKTKKNSRQDKLFQENYELVQIIARKFLNWKEPYEDLVQIGSLGLIKAIKRYSKRSGHNFTSFASPTIEGEIRHYLRDKMNGFKVSRKLIELNAKVNKINEAAKVSTGKFLTPKTIAKKLKVKVARIEKAKDAIKKHNTVSFDQPISTLKGGEGRITLGDTVGGHNEYNELIEKIYMDEALEKLPAREQSVIKMLFVDDVVQSKIAKKHKITQAQVSRIITNSLDQLKEILA